MNINVLRNYFIFCNVEYIFKDKKLYQQPYSRNKRYYNEHEIKPFMNGYRLQGLYVTIDFIKKELKQKLFTKYKQDETPF